MKKDKKKRSLVETARTGTVMGENASFNRILNKTIRDGINDIEQQAKRYANNPTPSMTGFVAEADHCATFNVRSALKRSTTRAIREANGNHGDYKIMKGSEVIREGEIKYYQTAEATENAMRGYGNKQRVGPSDQVDDIRKIAKRKAAKNYSSGKESRRKVALEHEEVANNVSDCITDGKTKSTPRTRKEMEKIAKKAKRGEIITTDIMPSPWEALKEAAISGAKTGGKIGGAMTGIISLHNNGRDLFRGKKSLEEALLDTATDTTKGALDGAVKGAAASAATAGSKYLIEKAGKEALKNLLDGSGPAIAAIAAVDIGKSAVQYLTGEKTGKEFLNESGEITASAAGGWVGTDGGAAIGSMICPGVGTIIGAVAGGLIGSIVPKVLWKLIKKV